MEEPPLIDAPAEPGLQRNRLHRFLLRTTITLFLLLLLLVLLSNFWMHSPWGRGWLERMIETRIGLATSIESAGWIPGGKFWIKNLRLAQPVDLPKASATSSPSTHDFAFIEEIAIQTDWRELMHGRREITAVKITRPTLHIPIELIASLATSQRSNSGLSTAAPVVVARQAPPNSPTKDAIAQAPKNLNPAATPPPAPQPSLQTAPRVTKKPTGMFCASKVQITLFHAASERSLIQSENLECSIPFEGDQAEGSITLGNLFILNQPVGKNMKIPLQWKSPVLATPILPLEIAGFSLEIQAQLAKLPGLPFSIGMQQKQQPWESPVLQSSLPYFASAEEMESLHCATGLLLAPDTWSGESIAQARKVRLRTLRGQGQDFFLIRHRLILAQSALHFVEFRALGDDTALLAHGTILGNGNFSLNSRLLASRRNATALEEKIHATSAELSVKLAPLYNEDRRVIDLLLGGSITQPWISADQGKHLLDLKKMISLWNTRNSHSP